MGHIYADPARWEKVADALERAADRGEAAGLDTEFYGVDPNSEGRPEFDVRKESCAGGRTRVHLWSVAVKRYPHVLHPRGYHLADGAVFLSDALDHPRLRRWLESPAIKVVHNLTVDAHSLANHNVVLGGAVNSLSRARWAWPERARGSGYSLDVLGSELLGVGKTEHFEELFSEEVEVLARIKRTEVKVCSCGEAGCRKRKGHEKMVEVTEEKVMKKERRRIPLESVVPGHPLWERAVAYSARDAILAIAVDDLVERVFQRGVPWPW